MVNAPTLEKSALYPASETWNNVHCATSQRMIGAFMMLSSVIGPETVEVLGRNRRCAVQRRQRARRPHKGQFPA